MLNHLSVKNFAIADHVEVNFDHGMTVLSGETGAGKSIILDALGLTLGDRADTTMVRHGSAKAEISAVFDLAKHPEALSWLEEHDLETGQECILRRVITADGRSRGYINGQPSPLQDLKALGEILIDIHSQHEHQSLMRKDNHRLILDGFGGLQSEAQAVQQAYRDWSSKAQTLARLESNQEETEARVQLLSFQVQEFDTLALQEGEIAELEQEQSSLANAEQLISGAHEALALCRDGDTNVGSLLSAASHSLQQTGSSNSALAEAINLIEEARIQVDEAGTSLSHFLDSFDLDPERLTWVEERLSAIYQLARKHRCAPEELTDVHFKLSEELSQYTDGGSNLEQLTEEVAACEAHYLKLAEQQRALRQQHAEAFETAVAEQLALMDMKNVRLSVQFTPLEGQQFSALGLDRIEFLLSTNPGQPAKALAKVASGGELSRVSLAIQVVIAQKSTIPTLVFDEVDVGIGGGTAQIVGRLLRSLGENGQVICVTHLPQVASQGQHHLFISKKEENGEVRSSIRALKQEERTREIARMLGGVEITQQTLAHAEEMLSLN